MFSVSSSGTFVNREETSNSTLFHCHACTFWFLVRENKRLFDSVLVGRDWLKYSNKVRNELVVIGVNQ